MDRPQRLGLRRRPSRLTAATLPGGIAAVTPACLSMFRPQKRSRQGASRREKAPRVSGVIADAPTPDEQMKSQLPTICQTPRRCIAGVWQIGMRPVRFRAALRKSG